MREYLVALIFSAALVFFAPFSHADEDVEDLIDVARSNSKVVAIVNGKRSIAVNLRPGEKVLWSESNGNLAAFLTEDRFFVISVFSGSWQVLRLKIDEADRAVVELSPNLALLVTEGRAIGFNIAARRFIEARIPLDDKLIAVESGKYVALVMTSRRAFGLAAKSSSFVETRLRAGENVEKVKVTASKVTVRTSDRLLSFVARGSSWREHWLD